MTKRSGILGAFGLLASGFALYWFLMSPSEVPFELRLCLPKSPASGLLILADDRGFFQSEGLKVQIQIEELGKDCVQKLVDQKADLAASNIPPLVSAIVHGQPLLVVTELASSNRNTSLVLHHQKGQDVSVSTNLTGKKVGLVEGTNSESFLRLYTKAHDIDLASFQITKATSLADLGSLLKNGEITAGVMWEPFLSKFLSSAPPDSYLTQDSSFYSQFCVLASQSQFASQNPKVLERFMRALDQAQKFNETHFTQSQQVMMSRLHYSDSDMPPHVWAKFRLGIGLSAVLISMMKEGQKPLEPPPDFVEEKSTLLIFQSLYPQALRKIDKGLVTYE